MYKAFQRIILCPLKPQRSYSSSKYFINKSSYTNCIKKRYINVIIQKRYYTAKNDDDDDDDDIHNDSTETQYSDGEHQFEHDVVEDDGDESSSIATTGGIIKWKTIYVLPVTERPCMPGLFYPIEIRDRVQIKKLVDIKRGNMGYVGIFLRKEVDNDNDNNKNDDDKEEEGNIIDDKPLGKADDFTVYDTPETEQQHATSSGVIIKSIDEVHEIGTYCSIRNIEIFPVQRPDAPESWQVWLTGHHRIKIIDAILKDNETLFQANVSHHEDPVLKRMKKEDATTAHAFALEIIKKLRIIAAKGPILKHYIFEVLRQVDNIISNPGLLGDMASGLTMSGAGRGGAELQEILNIVNISDNRLFKVLVLLDHEITHVQLQQDISKQVREKIEKNQVKYMKLEQLKILKKELGMVKDEKEEVIKKYRDRLEGKNVPEAIQKVIDEEFDKLATLEPQSAEFSVSRNYLDWLTILPWGVYTDDVFDLQAAEKQLNHDHYGLKDVKERVLEFIAVGNLLGHTSHGKIICLTGPPGVGKTSIGRSIATTLNRKFFRFSVGGMHDVAEIKGHRRTYIGAMPGKFVQALKTTESSNPVVLIDEIDKIGSHSYHGDPSSALLEALDPEQNSNFLDHYLDAPIDLSNVLFICTGNIEATIPGPLADRMEFIRIAGYVSHEKVHIAKEYLEPIAKKGCGVNDDQGDINTTAIEALVKSYCREAGVRNLQKHIEKVYRKIAFKLVKEKPKELPIVVTGENLSDFVGKPVFTSDRLHDITPPGVVMGMAWSQMGGSTLYIESVVSETNEKDHTGSMQVTGQLGDVMTESSSIALTVAKLELNKRGLDTDNFFNKRKIHMHIPEGATPKDGPSAGIAMVTSLLSLALNKSVKQDLAMTGEVTLSSCVLPIGGVREKVVAATRSGVKHIILPLENAHDWDELSTEVTQGLTVHFVSTYSDVFDVAFGKVRKKRTKQGNNKTNNKA